MLQKYIDCLADELFEEASDKMFGSAKFSYNDIKSRAINNFGCTEFLWDDFLKLRETIIERSALYLREVPMIACESARNSLSIKVKQIRATNFIEDNKDDERHLETLKMVDMIKEYIKEHPVKMVEPSVCRINGEYYDVLSKKQAEKMYHDYVTWLVTAGLV